MRTLACMHEQSPFKYELTRQTLAFIHAQTPPIWELVREISGIANSRPSYRGGAPLNDRLVFLLAQRANFALSQFNNLRSSCYFHAFQARSGCFIDIFIYKKNRYFVTVIIMISANPTDLWKKMSISSWQRCRTTILRPLCSCNYPIIATTKWS